MNEPVYDIFKHIAQVTNPMMLLVLLTDTEPVHKVHIAVLPLPLIP